MAGPPKVSGTRNGNAEPYFQLFWGLAIPLGEDSSHFQVPNEMSGGLVGQGSGGSGQDI